MPSATELRPYIEQVRAANDIVEIVGARVALRGNMGLCPFHRESNPSFSVSKSRQIYRCFSCKAGGDVFQFVMAFDKLDFMEALRTLADRAGIAPPAVLDREIESFKRDLAQKSLIEAVVTYYQTCLGEEHREYLIEKRGLPASVIEDYLIGFADGSLASRIEGLDAAQVGILDSIGVITLRRNPEPGQSPYRDRLRDRIIFPILERGRPMFLTGRTVLDDPEVPKYLHQRGTAPLYNEDALLGNPRSVFVVEGPVDALSLVAWGYENTVGLQGGMRASSVKRLLRVPRVLSVMDADAAGLGSTHAMVKALGPGRVRVVPLPPGQDPNDVYRTTPKEIFDRWVRDALDPIKFLLLKIPKSTSLELPDRLRPIMEILVTAEAPIRLAYEEEMIAPYFGWNRRERAAYAEWLDELALGPSSVCPACTTVIQRRTRRA